MKKIMFLVFVSISMVFVFAACNSNANTPTTPAATVTPTVVVVADGSALDVFSDTDMANSLGGTWTITGDGAAGGQSTVFNGAVLSGGVSNNALAIGVTLNAQLDYDTNNYTSLTCISYYGYTTVEASLYQQGCNLTASNVLSFAVKGSMPASTYFRLMFYNAAGQFVTSPTILYNTDFTGSWAYKYFLYNSPVLPAGAAYTANDVLSKVTKIVMVFKFGACSLSQTEVVDVMIDDITLSSL